MPKFLLSKKTFWAWKSITSLTCYFGKVSHLWCVTSEKYHIIDLLLIQVTHLWCVTFWLLTSSMVRWCNTACIGRDGAVLLDASELMSTWVKEKSCEVMIASNREREREKEKIILWKAVLFPWWCWLAALGAFSHVSTWLLVPFPACLLCFFTFPFLTAFHLGGEPFFIVEEHIFIMVSTGHKRM